MEGRSDLRWVGGAFFFLSYFGYFGICYSTEEGTVMEGIMMGRKLVKVWGFFYTYGLVSTILRYRERLFQGF